MSEDKKLPPPLPGNRINNVGVSFPAVDHKGHKADDHSIARSKKPALRRKHAQQKINSLQHQKGVSYNNRSTPDIPRELINQASRPQKRSK